MQKKILVVDDEPDVVETVRSRLEVSGYLVITAENGREGFLKAKQEKPDLVVLDVMMPEVDGAMAAQKLKEDPVTKNIPIIFLTCLVKKEELGAGIGNIAENIFIAKPFDPKELLATIQEKLK